MHYSNQERSFFLDDEKCSNVKIYLMMFIIYTLLTVKLHEMIAITTSRIHLLKS